MNENITFTWDDDPAQREPFMRCRECGANLCTVEEDDTLAVLVSVAEDHQCGAAREVAGRPGTTNSLRDPDEPDAGADRAQASDTPSERTSADWLLAIHQMLYPERYPRDAQPDHIFWLEQAPDEEDLAAGEKLEPWEWSSETIEFVANMLERALAQDPRARLKP